MVGRMDVGRAATKAATMDAYTAAVKVVQTAAS